MVGHRYINIFTLFLRHNSICKYYKTASSVMPTSGYRPTNRAIFVILLGTFGFNITHIKMSLLYFDAVDFDV